MTISHSTENMKNKISQTNNQPHKNPWVIGFMGIVATFLIVNAVFVITAFYTSPGLVVEDYYERGREYEKNALKMLAATHNTHDWHTKLDMAKNIKTSEKNAIRFIAVDGRGLPIEGAQVQFVAYRPSDASADIFSEMKEIAPGMFESIVAFPLKGIWDVNIKVQQGQDKYELAKRISVQSI